MGLQSGIEKARTKLATASSKFLIDRCDILSPPATPVNDGYGNALEVDSTVASNIPCSYEPLSGPGIQIVSGGVTMTMDHKITLPFTAETRAIEPSQRIKVLARTNNAEIVFEQPTFLRDSLGVFVEVAAKVRDV